MARGKGASDQRLLTPLRRRSPGCRGDRRRPPDEFQISHFIYDFTAAIARTQLRCNVFFYFVIPLSSKTPSFESFLGRCPARNALKSGCFSGEVPEKVKVTSHDSSGGTGRLWRSGSALGGSGGALGDLGRALGGSIYRKTPLWRRPKAAAFLLALNKVCPSSQHSTRLASQQSGCLGSQQGTCLASQQSRPSQSSPRASHPPEPPRADPDLHSLPGPPELSRDAF